MSLREDKKLRLTALSVCEGIKKAGALPHLSVKNMYSKDTVHESNYLR